MYRLSIVCFKIKIPLLNAVVEQQMGSNERNRLPVEMVKSELCVELNYNKNRPEFSYFQKNPVQAKLSNCSTINQNYLWLMDFPT